MPRDAAGGRGRLWKDVFTEEIWELEKGPGTIKKYRFRILFGARQGGEPREPDLLWIYLGFSGV